MSKKVKIFVIVVLGITLIIAGGSFLGSSSKSSVAPASDSPLVSSQVPAGVSTTASSVVVPNDFSNILSTVKSIVIDTSIFTDPTYRSLRDHPVDLGVDDVGRPNPFAPVGVNIGVISGTAAPQVPIQEAQVQTLQPTKITPTTAEFGVRVALPDTTPATIIFEYGTSTVFGSVTSPIAVSKTDTYLFTTSGLLPNTTYNVRAVLVRGSSDSVKGNTMVFTTTKR